jgi:hypothetical protein
MNLSLKNISLNEDCVESPARKSKAVELPAVSNTEALKRQCHLL